MLSDGTMRWWCLAKVHHCVCYRSLGLYTLLKKLNYPNECIRVNIGHKVVIIIHIRSVIIRVFRRIKMFIIILCKPVHLIEVVGIKIVTLNTEVSFDRFGKELRLISVSFGGFHIKSARCVSVCVCVLHLGVF